MAEYDLFVLTGLPFDPPKEKSPDKVRATIKKAIEDWTGIWNTETQDLKRKIVRERLDFLEGCLKEGTACSIFTNEKLNVYYDELAKKRVEQEIDNLKNTVAVLKQHGSKIITDGTIRIYCQKTKLSKKHVEEVFLSAGYSITQIDPLKAMPNFPAQAEQTYNDLEALRKSKDPNPNGADLTLAIDLYAFVAYLHGEPENAAAYRNKSTSELKTALDGFSKKYSGHQPQLQKLWANLATAGKIYVFNSEENRQAYESFLKYKTPSLTKLFSTLGGIPKSTLLDSKFAEGCIKQISEIFGDYEVALAIYNKEAGLKDEPYIPEKSVFLVKCSHCQNLSEFAEIIEAQKVNECSHCGKPLYKQCNKCHKNVLASLDRCPECGFVFASTVMFTKYFAAAEQAFHKSDFESAHNFLFQAQSADPGEKFRINELAVRITAEEKKYKKPINDLRKLIADKTFEKASNTIADIIGKFPELNVSAFETQINSALSQACMAFNNAKRFSPSKQADECLAILRDCIDFNPAISYLEATPPETCKGFVIGIDNSLGCTNISWSRSLEQGISYRLVRKKGKVIPTNEMDGEVLIDDIKNTSYRDKSILPGQYYSYAIFAIRFGVFSSAAGKTVILLADVTDVYADQNNTSISLTWNIPKNCTGVTIHRIQYGKDTVLTNSAHGSFEDTDVQYGVAYSYKLCANYANLPASQGVDIVITPMLEIDSFTISAKQLKENRYKVSWNINRCGINMRILIDEKRAKELKSDIGSYDLELPVDGFHAITVLAYSGGNWLRSDNILQINTYSPCFIDKTVSYFQEDLIAGLQETAYSIELHLKINGSIPLNVVGFYYAVRTGSSHNRWPTKDEIDKSDDIHRIGVEAYKKNNEILYTEIAREEGAYYVSLFTIYSVGGKEIISNPKSCRFDRPLTADLFWKISKSLLGDLKLSIEIFANRPIIRIPEWTLCVCGKNQHLLNYKDAKATRLLTIPEINLEFPQRVYRKSYDVKPDLSINKLCGTKFFFFEVAPIASEKFTLRWTKGFTGKV